MQKFINNWSTTITQALSPSDTLVHIDIESANLLAVGFQQGDYYLLTLDNGVYVEIVKVAAINANQLFVQRGQENTLTPSWNTGSKLEARITANTLSNLSTTVDCILTVDNNILVAPNGNVMHSDRLRV